MTPTNERTLTEAERVMYGMTFVSDPEPHEFIPCPGAAFLFCRVCARQELAGKHVHLKGKR